MAVDDVVESKMGVAGLAVAVTAAVLSPKVRGVLRQGAVYGLAGALRAGDAIAAFARSVGQGVRQAGDATLNGDGEPVARQRRRRVTAAARQRTRRTAARMQEAAADE